MSEHRTDGAVQVDVVVRHPDVVGEGPVYDAVSERLLWVDCVGQRVRQLRFQRDGTRSIGASVEVPGYLGAILPRASGGMLAMVGGEFVTLSDDGTRETFASLEPVVPGVGMAELIFQDALCDPEGRVFAGWMSRHADSGLVRLDPDGSVESVLTDIVRPNGMGWSPTAETFYLIDYPLLTVYAFDYDRSTARLSNRRPLVEMERWQGFPDGMCVDDEGCLWVAMVFASEVRRYSPEGTLVDAIRTPTLAPVSCAFGGPDRDQLFVTSWLAPDPFPQAAVDVLGDFITAEQIETFTVANDPLGGALLVCRPGVTGPAAIPFAG